MLPLLPKLILLVIKSRRLRLAGHVARMKEGRNAFKILTGKPFVGPMFNCPLREVNDHPSRLQMTCGQHI
jgi:hypothetical protein